MSTIRRPRVGATLLIVGLALTGAACSNKTTQTKTADDSTASSAPAGSPNEVVVKTFAFTPKEITVKAGTKVTWTNRDQILHTVTNGTGPTNKTGLFDGQMPDAGTSFSFTFDKPGRYDYFCTRHDVAPSMHGTVVVT